MRSIVCTLVVYALAAYGNTLLSSSPLPVTDPCDGISDYLTPANVELSYEAAFGESCIEISTTLAFGTDGFINELDEDGTVLATYEYSIAASGAQCLLSSTQGSCNAQVLEFNGDMSAISMTHDGETATLTTMLVPDVTDPIADAADITLYASDPDGELTLETLDVTTPCGQPYEYNGYSYETVLIDDDCWFAENLQTTTYNDGTAIPEALSNADWSALSTGARTDYDGDASNVATYGRLYNWFAVSNEAGLCPTGWHVPTDDEYTALKTYVMSETATSVGTALKATTSWNDASAGVSGNGTDEFGFAMLGSGRRQPAGYHTSLGIIGFLWTSTEYVDDTDQAWGRNLYNTSSIFVRDKTSKQTAFSVRCVTSNGTADAKGVSSDDVGIATMSLDRTSFDGCNDLGDHTVTLTVTDDAGNSSTDEFTVTVADTISPNAIAQAVTVQLDATGNGTLAAADVDGGSTDNCSVASLSLSQTAFTCADLGTNTVTLTVTDGSGNTATAQATITVEDNLAPDVSVDDITVELDASGSATLATSDVFDITGADAPAQANLIGRWTFEPGFETTDATGNWGDLNLNGATVTGGKLDLNVGSHVLTTSYSGSVIGEKTLVAWVEIEDLDVEYGSPISLQATNTDRFDGIIYAEQQARRFMAGSSHWLRTQAFSPGFEETETGTLVCIAITYQDEAGSLRVSGYRNGQPIGSYLKGSLPTWSDADAEIIFGPRHTDPNGGALHGSVDMLLEEARLYDRALTDEEMADLYDAVQFSDNCSLASASLSVTEFDCDDLSSAVANTLTVTDGSGNSTTASFDVTVVDNVDPTAVGQAATVQLDATGNGTLAAADVDGGSTDNCSVASLSLSQTAFTCDDIGDNTVTLTVTDGSGNTATTDVIVTVEDNVEPTATANSMLVYLDGNGEAEVDSAGITIFHDDFESYPMNKTVFNYTDLWEAEEGSSFDAKISNWANNTDGGNRSLRLKANGVRVALGNLSTYGTPVRLEYYCTFGSPSGGNGQNSQSEITFMDDADNDIFQYTLDGNEPTEYVDGLWTVTEVQAHQSPAQTWHKVYVVFDFDNDEAELYVDDVLIATAAGADAAMVSQIRIETSGGGWSFFDDFYVKSGMPVTAEDNCGIATITVTPDLFDCDDLGEAPVTYDVTDLNGNSTSVDGTITVEDHIAPATVAVETATVELDATGAGSLTADDIDDGSADNCSIALISISQTDFSCSDIASNPLEVVLTATDASGNSSTDTTLVTVADNVNPTAVAQNLTAQLDASGAVTITADQIDNGSSDACGIADLSLDKSTFGCADLGANTVILTVTDNNSNTATATATVTVEDNVAPTVLVQNITVQLDASGAATITPGQIDNGSSDACGINTMTLNKTSFGCADVGDNTVTLTVTDNNSNVATATATVTVQDNVKPTAVCQNVPAYLDGAGNASVIAADLDGGSTDACGIADLSIDISSFDCDDIGPNNVTLTVTDNNSNEEMCIAVVTVIDTISPTALAHNLSVELDAGGTVSITTADVDDGSYDNCEVASMALTQYDFSCDDVGDNDVTLSVTDVNGNVSYQHATVTVTVSDDLDPTAITQDITVELDANGSATITAAQIDNSSTDNCGIASLTLDTDTFDCDDLGANTVTLTATDGGGNTDQATATVTVQDNIDPVAVTQNLTIELDANGEASITAEQVNDGSSDNCSITSMTLTKTDFGCSDLGANTVSLTVTDPSSNTHSANATITVQDNIAPTALVQAVTIQIGQDGQASITAGDADNGSYDNCGITSMTLSQTDFTCADVGTTTLTFTIEDEAGNETTADVEATVLSAITIDEASVTATPTSLLDTNGEIEVTVSLGTAASVQLEGLNGSDDHDFTLPAALDGVGPGYYSITCTDANGCVSPAVILFMPYDLCCACGVNDIDTDGICDDEDNCTDPSQPNYNDPSNTPCPSTPLD